MDEDSDTELIAGEVKVFFQALDTGIAYRNVIDIGEEGD